MLCLLSNTPAWASSQDSTKYKNAVRIQFGPSYAGWDIQSRYARTIGAYEVGLGLRLVLDGNLDNDASLGSSLFLNYLAINNGKLKAFVGPTVNFLKLKIDDATAAHYYFEGSIQVGMVHTVYKQLELGYQLSYGATLLLLSDKYSDNRPTEFKQSSSINIFMGYRF